MQSQFNTCLCFISPTPTTSQSPNLTLALTKVLNYCLRFPLFVATLEYAGRRNIQRYVSDPGLVERLTPNFSIGCKRILQSNQWYRALAKPNVDVVSGISKVEAGRVHASDGSSCEADVIVFGTGFEVASCPIAQHIVGASGSSLAVQWDGHPEAYLGTMLPDCPNAFMAFGPNTYSFSSAFAILEAQLSFILSAITTAREQDIAAIAVSEKGLEQYNQQVQNSLKLTVWGTGCSSYFQTGDGYNTVNWPWTTFYLRYRLRSFNASSAEFEITKHEQAKKVK